MIKAGILLRQDDTRINPERIREIYHFELIKIFFSYPDNEKRFKEESMQELTGQIQKSGVELLVCRGYLAAVLKERLSIPVIELRYSTHDLVQALMQAKALCVPASPANAAGLKAVPLSQEQSAPPLISLLAPDNMHAAFSIDDLEQQLQIRLHVFPISAEREGTDFLPMSRQISAEKPDAFVGGRPAVEIMEGYGIPGTSIELGLESYDNAWRRAESAVETLLLQKRSSANLNAVLDYSKYGIIEINANAEIILINHFVEWLLMTSSPEISGQPVLNYIEGIGRRDLINAIRNNKEINYTRLRIANTDFVAGITPIVLDGRVEAAIIALYEGRQAGMILKSEELPSNVDTVTGYTFDSYITRSAESRFLIRQAEAFARLSVPVCISGPAGAGQDELADCFFHFLKKQEPNAVYLKANCSAMTEEEQEEYLFGLDTRKTSSEADAIDLHTPGILYLRHAEQMSLRLQRRLARLYQTQDQNVSIRLQILIWTEADPRGSLDSELFYTLFSGLLAFSPLAERREDISGWIEDYLPVLEKRFGRMIHLTKDAMKTLTRYDWPGNLPELRNVCRRIFIEAASATVGAADVRRILLEGRRTNILTTRAKNTNMPSVPVRDSVAFSRGSAVTEAPTLSPSENGSSKASSDSDYLLQAAAEKNTSSDMAAEELRLLLDHYHGSRMAVANALGISTTTLWRRMKKYGLIQGSQH